MKCVTQTIDARVGEREREGAGTGERAISVWRSRQRDAMERFGSKDLSRRKRKREKEM